LARCQKKDKLKRGGIVELNEFVVYQSKPKQAGISLLGILMILASLYVIFNGLFKENNLILGIGVVGFFTFAIFEVFVLKQLFIGKKLVVLNKQGFYDYSVAFATKDLLIPWTDIAKIEIANMASQKFVSVYVKNSEKFLANISPIQQQTSKANKKLGFGDININLKSAKDCSEDQLLEKMNQYLEDSNSIPHGS
jgi:hypothetical protein